MAIAAFSHTSEEVKELGIRAFEYWANEPSLAALEHVDVGNGWLNDYLQEVIEDLRTERVDVSARS